MDEAKEALKPRKAARVEQKKIDYPEGNGPNGATSVSRTEFFGGNEDTLPSSVIEEGHVEGKKHLCWYSSKLFAEGTDQLLRNLESTSDPDTGINNSTYITQWNPDGSLNFEFTRKFNPDTGLHETNLKTAK